jgi:hypothetical protein
LLGYSITDEAHESPLVGLVFHEDAQLCIGVAGPERPPPNLPSELQGIIAATGGWIEIGIPPLYNFYWFLAPNEMRAKVDLAQESAFFMRTIGLVDDDTTEDALPLTLWPDPVDCILLGRVANGDVLVLVQSGPLMGNVYLVSHDVPGLMNHLDQHDYLTWIKWVLLCGLASVKGEQWSHPWYY